MCALDTAVITFPSAVRITIGHGRHGYRINTAGKLITSDKIQVIIATVMIFEHTLRQAISTMVYNSQLLFLWCMIHND